MTEESTRHCCNSFGDEQDAGCNAETEAMCGCCEQSSQAEDEMSHVEGTESGGCCDRCEAESQENEEMVGESETTEDKVTEEDLKLELEEKKMQIALLASELQKEQSMREELASRLQRLQAEFDNYRRRTQTEKEELAQFAIQDFLLRLLPVIDNFERAIGAASDAKDVNSFSEGVEMIYKQFLDVLIKEGVVPIESVGHPFDPNKHEAFMVEETSDVEDNTVLEEFQKGYEFKGKVIRPSMVKVSQRA